MPKLFREKKISNLNTKTSASLEVFEKNKHYPSPTREWYNSIFSFNKNNLNLIPFITLAVSKLIKSFFNLYNARLERKMRTKRLLRRLRKLVSNRYYVSRPSFKHTTNKVIVNLFVFNRQRFNYSSTLKKWYMRLFFNKVLRTNKKNSFSINKIKKNGLTKKVNKNDMLFRKNLTKKLINRFNIINEKGVKTFNSINKNKQLLLKAIKTLESKNYSVTNFQDLTKYTRNFYKKLIRKSLKKLRMFFYYRKLLYINKSKVNYTYLQYLKKYMEKIYNKNVEFNIINLKRFYLNSDILSQAITMKIKRTRRKMVRHLRKMKNKVKIWKKKVFLGYIKNEKMKYLGNNKLSLQRYVIDNLKYKHVTGFRLEAKGRLSRRNTASRSVSKVRYKGNLLDIDSSYRGISTVMLKGNLKSNTQYTALKSKTRIGSFGIKGWVSGN